MQDNTEIKKSTQKENQQVVFEADGGGGGKEVNKEAKKKIPIMIVAIVIGIALLATGVYAGYSLSKLKREEEVKEKVEEEKTEGKVEEEGKEEVAEEEVGKAGDKEEQEVPKLAKGNVEEVKNKLLTLIPSEYEVVEKNCQGAFTLQGICSEWYEIYSEEYSDVEMDYLNRAGLQYFSDVANVKISGQVGDVTYSEKDEKWVYKEGGREDTFLEIKEFGDTSVSYISLGGSQAFYDYYIMDDSDEAIVLFIPRWNRIRCDLIEEDIEKTQCEEYLYSLWGETNSPDDVPEEVYERYYNDLLGILQYI